MRDKTERETIEQLMQLLGQRARSPGTIYFTGGACAVLLGWRATTLDIDLKLAPEPEGVFAAISVAKEELGVNIELAAPDDFVPAIPGWQDRSIFIATVGPVEFRHYDFYGQALAKIERGHQQDAKDVRSMFARKLIEPAALHAHFENIFAQIIRYPALEANSFRQKLDSVLTDFRESKEPDGY